MKNTFIFLMLAFIAQPVSAQMATAQERLYEASYKCDSDEIQKAIHDGADVNLFDEYLKSSPLMLAVIVPFTGSEILMEKRIKAIKTLIKRGAAINVDVLICALYNFIEVDTYAEKADKNDLILYVKLVKTLLKNTPASLRLK
jgi:hypothetical protein